MRQRWNTIGSTKFRGTQSADDKHDLENLGRLGRLLPGTQVLNLERASPARIDREVKNLMPRCARHCAVQRERRLANLLDQRTGHRLSLPRIAGPRSRGQRNFQRIPAIESKVASVVVERNKNHARTSQSWHREREDEQKQQAT